MQPEPPLVQRSGFIAVHRPFDDPVDPSGRRKPAGRPTQLAQAPVRMLAEEPSVSRVQHQNPFREGSRPFQLVHEMLNLHVERRRFHRTSLDHQGDVWEPW